jgi:long-chain acyl-CoA synthetase
MARSRASDPGVEVRAHDLALLQYTGGTTGVAKAAMLSHRNLLANTLQVRAWFKNLAEPDGGDVVMGVLPLFHIYAITTIMNFSIAGGGTMGLQPRFVLQDVLKGIERERPHVPGRADHVHGAERRAESGALQLALASKMRSAVAPLPRVKSRPASRSRPAARLVEGYGLTEASR